MSLEDRNTEFSKVEGELIVLSITSANVTTRPGKYRTIA
jgi:hypothetical protein